MKIFLLSIFVVVGFAAVVRGQRAVISCENPSNPGYNSSDLSVCYPSSGFCPRNRTVPGKCVSPAVCCWIPVSEDDPLPEQPSCQPRPVALVPNLVASGCQAADGCEAANVVPGNCPTAPGEDPDVCCLEPRYPNRLITCEGLTQRVMPGLIRFVNNVEVAETFVCTASGACNGTAVNFELCGSGQVCCFTEGPPGVSVAVKRYDPLG